MAATISHRTVLVCLGITLCNGGEVINPVQKKMTWLSFFDDGVGEPKMSLTCYSHTVGSQLGGDVKCKSA